MSRPSRRARKAEVVAQAVLSRSVPTDRLSTVVAGLRDSLDVDHAQISILVDRQIAIVVDHRAGLPGDAGTDPGTVPVSSLDDTLCVVALRTDQQLGIADAAADERVASTLPVTSGAIGSYLGSPLRVVPGSSEDGDERFTAGVLCVYSAATHDWTADERAELDRAAVVVARELGSIYDVAAGVDR